MNSHQKWINILLLCIFQAVLGCATTKNTNNVEVLPVSVSHEEFIKGIAVPIYDPIQVFDSYYHENATLPESLPMLQDYAVKKNISLNAQSIRDWRVSGSPQKTEITFQIILPASRAASGQATTAWRLEQIKSPSNSEAIGFSIMPLSRFCILDQQPDPVGDLFFKLTVATILRVPLPQQHDNGLCLGPPAGERSEGQNSMEKKLKNRLQEMRQQRQNSQQSQ